MATTKKFKTQELKNLVEGGETSLEKVECEISSVSKWSINYRMVFKTPDGEFYSSFYSEGATELQDECAYDYEGKEVDCFKVKKVEKLVTVYEEE